jgi:hypothetical protein
VLAAVLLAAAWLMPQTLPSRGSLSVNDVMRRVEKYVADYGERASAVVGVERYDQEARGSVMRTTATRSLVSEFAIVKAESIHGWLGFRDVIEVDGQALPDHAGRLQQVLTESQGRFDEARRLSDESARYNIGHMERNFNQPTGALFFFVAENHDRFKFSARRVAGDGTWEIAFDEKTKPTLIRTPDGQSVPSSGTLWVRPEDGVVMRTQLKTELTNARGRQTTHGSGIIDVTYRRFEDLGMWLPAVMTESFESREMGGVTPAWTREDGHAEYSKYRIFTTSARIK